MPVRPTPDSLRERVFAVLGEEVERARVLDLFAGSGAVGLEALSRGAQTVTFVESHRGAARVLRENCALFQIDSARARVLVQDATAAVKTMARRGELFDLAWADPPFERWEDGLEALAAAFSTELLVPAALACLECPERAVIEPILPEGLEVVRDLGGGASRVVLIRRSSVGA